MSVGLPGFESCGMTNGPIRNSEGGVARICESQTHVLPSAMLCSTPPAVLWMNTAHGLNALTDRYGYPPAVLKICATSPNGKLSPNGRQARKAVRTAAAPEVTIRMGPLTRRSHAVVPLGAGTSSPSAAATSPACDARRALTAG